MINIKNNRIKIKNLYYNLKLYFKNKINLILGLIILLLF